MLQMLCLTFVLLPVVSEFHIKEAEEVSDTGRKQEKTEIGPQIAITFDDGPAGETTEMLLDGLKERGVKATFFVIGVNIEKEGNRDLIKRMHREGHLIGNHTYHHADLSQLNQEQALRELEMTDVLLEELTGERTAFVRPPFGNIPEGTEEQPQFYVKWTVDTLDWTTKDEAKIVKRAVTDTEEGDILLLHDCYESSVRSALQIIDILKEKGYEFVTVEQLLIK